MTIYEEYTTGAVDKAVMAASHIDESFWDHDGVPDHCTDKTGSQCFLCPFHTGNECAAIVRMLGNAVDDTS